ncbi:hypothetical protein ACOXVJ_15100 [Pseudomonas knackmussii]|uniref:hypothetical protein n=1 Tax=Pseudomonas knackmussii TaxID=65741 RepID=UPI003BD701D8
MSRRLLSLFCLFGALLSLPAMAMKALDDEQLEGVSGAGLGFFIDGFSYDQATATAKITGVKNSTGADVAVDITGAYIKGAGSQRGTQDVKAYLGTPMHPFTLGPIKYASGQNIPVGSQALQLKTPTWTDPINDTHQFGLWSYYQGCLYGEAGCTDPTKATTKINGELSGLTSQRDAIYTTYGTNLTTLKSGIDTDMAAVNTQQAQVATAQADVNAKYASMSSLYDQLPSQICGITCQSKPALGQTYSCPLFANCSAATNYNNSVSAYGTSSDNLESAQQNLSAAWNVQRNGRTLSQRASDYDRFVQLCGAQSGSATTCVGGSIKRTQGNVATVQLVASTLQTSGNTRIQGLDIGLKTTFTLPSVAYNSDGSQGATTTRQDYFAIDIQNFTLNGSYLNIWGAAAGMKLSMSLQMYADKMIISGCQTCTDNDRAVLKNIYFDLNLGDANYQPATLTVASTGDLVLNAPGVTWANHDAFYQNVQKSNISIGDLSISGTDLGSQAIRGMRIDYLNVQTHALPR